MNIGKLLESDDLTESRSYGTCHQNRKGWFAAFY
jgi:hypothetical protein